MPEYQELTDSEKAQIKINAIRNFEYQMYTLEIEIIAENAKSEPDSERLSILNQRISELETQISAIQ